MVVYWVQRVIPAQRIGAISDPKRPVRTIVQTMGRQSGQSGRGFQKPGSVRPKPQKPADAQAKSPDAQVKSPDAQAKPPDAQAKPADAQVKPSDPGKYRQSPQQRVLLAYNSRLFG